MELVSYLSIPPQVLMTWCLMQQKENCAFTYFTLLLKYAHMLHGYKRCLD
jgi:hypothetical protein